MENINYLENQLPIIKNLLTYAKFKNFNINSFHDGETI